MKLMNHSSILNQNQISGIIFKYSVLTIDFNHNLCQSKPGFTSCLCNMCYIIMSFGYIVSIKFVFADGYAPFLSMSSRSSFLNPGDNVIAAPGPGQYDPAFPQDNVKVSIFWASFLTTEIPRYGLHSSIHSQLKWYKTKVCWQALAH